LARTLRLYSWGYAWGVPEEPLLPWCLPMPAPHYSLRALLLYVGFWAVALGIFVPFARQIHMPLLWLTIIAGAGGVIGLFSGRGGRILSLSAGAWGMPIAVMAVPLLAFALWAILAQSPLGGDYELRGVSYGTFCRRTDTSEIDPVGAKDVYLYVRVHRDSGFSFLKMTIGEDDYGKMLARRRASAANTQPGCYVDDTAAMKKSDGLLMFNDSELLEAKPEWWALPGDAGSLISHVVRCDDGRGLATTVKGLWIYDPTHELLWIVESR